MLNITKFGAVVVNNVEQISVEITVAFQKNLFRMPMFTTSPIGGMFGGRPS